MPRWTDEQRAAIEARGENLLLAAAAGSGKTTVMVERILSLIREGASIDDMLIVTFTRASAADMRAKLTEKLAEMADMGDAHGRDQISRLESASISTIHAFCTSLLRTYFETAGVDPAFRILDDAENAVCEDAAVDEAMEIAYARMDEGMKRLTYGRSTEKVRELAVELYHAMQERPDPDAWMRRALELAEGDGSAWREELRRAAGVLLKRAIAFSRAGVTVSMKPDGTQAYADALNGDIAMLEEICCMDYAAMREYVGRFKQITPKTPRKPKGADWPLSVLELREQAKNLRKQADDTVKKAAKLLRYDPAEAMEDIHEDVPAMQALFALVQDIAGRHAGRKAEKSALTFSDLEHKSLELLRRPEIADAVRLRYQYVFVDEYQDVSDVQEELISRVVRENNRFMVGDVKQSIYRFRQAEPALFLEHYRRYGAGDGGRLIALTRNFRSRSSILDFTNCVFEHAMIGGESEIEYDELARLNPGAEYEGAHSPIELHLLAKRGLKDAAEAEDDDGDDALEEMSHVEKEASVAVAEIRRLMAEDPTLRYRDIAILTRTGRSVVPVVLSALLDAGIPAYADGSAGYFEAVEVQVFLAYLTLVENHRRDEALIAVLRSQMQRLTTPELALIRAESREGSFYDAVRAYALHDNDLGRRLAEFLRTLEMDRTLARSMPLAKLFAEIWRRTGYADAMLALPGGKQRHANLQRLAAKADQYEANQSGGLTGFLRYAERMKAHGDDEVAHTVGEADDVVRLMTVHKSKGLEFPVVIAMGLGRNFRTERGDDNLLVHRDLGMGMAHVDAQLATRRDTIARLAIGNRKQTEEHAEELRILYVLLTRAKHRLILIGGVNHARKAIDRWYVGAAEPTMYANELDVVMGALIGLPGAVEAIDPDGFGRLQTGTAQVNIHWWDETTITAAEAAHQKRRKDVTRALLEAADGVYQPEIRDEALLQAMRWRYPYENAVKQPIKLTASGLLRQLEGPDVIPELAPRPVYMTEEGMTGAEKGSAVHAAMQNLDLERLRDVAPVQMSLLGLVAEESRMAQRALWEDISCQLDEMLMKGILTPAMREVVPESMIARFFAGETGRRVLASETVHREWSFNLRMRTEDALSPEELETFAGTIVLVQGTIDMCFIEDGEWILLDYKTDRSSDIDEIKAHYARQLQLYATALERITGIPVRQKLLCLLRRGMILEL